MLKTRLSRFLRDDEGAVTVDWVVLTGGLMIFGVLTTRVVIEGTTDTSASVGAIMDNAVLATVSFN